MSKRVMGCLIDRFFFTVLYVLSARFNESL